MTLAPRPVTLGKYWSLWRPLSPVRENESSDSDISALTGDAENTGPVQGRVGIQCLSP